MKNTGFFPAKDGRYSLYTATWLPDDGPPKAVLHIVHGISEHIDRYDHFATFLAGNGFAVVGCDLPGHGRSVSAAEDRGFFAEEDGWKLVTQGLYELHDSLKEPYAGLPCFLLGHSMGSFLVRTMLIDYPELCDGVLLSGTGQPAEPLLQAGVRLLNYAIHLRGPRAHSARLQSFVLNTVKKLLAKDKQEEDPLRTYTFSISLLRDMADGLLYIGDQEHLAGVNTHIPVLFFSGDHDPVGEHGEGVRRVYDALTQAGFTDLTLTLYPNGPHEMLNEPNRMEVYEDILTWLSRQMEDTP